MAQMFLGAKIRQISYISKFLLAINASLTKYSYISNQKGVVIEVDNLVFLYSAAHSLGFRSILPSAGVTLRFTTCLWSATPSEFLLLSPIKTRVALRSPLPVVCQPFGLAFFSRASYKSTILRAPQIDPEQTAPSPSLALMIRSNFGLSLV